MGMRGPARNCQVHDLMPIAVDDRELLRLLLLRLPERNCKFVDLRRSAVDDRELLRLVLRLLLQL